MLAEDENLAWPRRVQARSDDIRSIVVSPTRELAEQIGNEAKVLCQGTGIKVQIAVGGTMKSAMLQKARREGCHLLIATPGRLNDLLEDDRSGIDAPRLSSLVLDEADRMLDVGFEKDLAEIVRRLPPRDQVPRQTLLFSATIPKNVISLARTYVDNQNFEFVQTIRADEVPTHEQVPQYVLPVRGYSNMFPAMLELFEREVKKSTQDGGMPFKAIVFLPTTAMVEMTSHLFDQIRRSNHWLPPTGLIHSKLTQNRRTFAADDFRAARTGILFSSDVTARGMDFPNVSHVIQVGVPPNSEQYIHRIGRTGRAGKGGQGWILVTQSDVSDARRTLPGLPIQRATGIETADYDLSSEPDNHPPAVAHVNEGLRNIPKFVLHDAYMSLFAVPGPRLEDRVEDLNEWVKLGWGWPQPPAFDLYTARKRRLLHIRGIRVEERSQDDGERERGFGSGSGRSFGSGRNSGSGFDRDSGALVEASVPVPAGAAVAISPTETTSIASAGGGGGGRGGGGSRGFNNGEQGYGGRQKSSF